MTARTCVCTWHCGSWLGGAGTELVDWVCSLDLLSLEGEDDLGIAFAHVFLGAACASLRRQCPCPKHTKSTEMFDGHNSMARQAKG